MSYRPRRGRSRTPPRFRPGHPLIRTERPPEDLKRSREREESKRGRWESDRGRPRASKNEKDSSRHLLFNRKEVAATNALNLSSIQD
ncbi:hypothetical protein FQR65_LT05815 [Abscondita terminalis]|nr:hypothetical protein FQR65_LT05815 [Abscondita terminalis]